VHLVWPIFSLYAWVSYASSTHASTLCSRFRRIKYINKIWKRSQRRRSFLYFSVCFSWFDIPGSESFLLIPRLLACIFPDFNFLPEVKNQSPNQKKNFNSINNFKLEIVDWFQKINNLRFIVEIWRIYLIDWGRNLIFVCWEVCWGCVSSDSSIPFLGLEILWTNVKKEAVRKWPSLWKLLLTFYHHHPHQDNDNKNDGHEFRGWW
jgi:hypothetical protein